MNDNILWYIDADDIRTTLECDNPTEAEIERVCDMIREMSFSDTADYICDCLEMVRDEAKHGGYT